MDQIQTVQQFFCASLGRSLCHGNEHHGIDPNIVGSGHHYCSFSAQLSNCNLATCWHIELSILGLLNLSIGIHLRKSFSCCMKFFQNNNPWAGLEGILHNHRKTLMSNVHLCLLSWEGFPRQTCINQVSKTRM